MVYVKQRVRDPLHNIIGFEDTQFENMLWDLINARPFQRLRRVKQLGFSNFVYPGASHTRFAHSIGVFHTARSLMSIIEEYLGKQRYQDVRGREALAAALLHDVGHGAFSHAFEDVGKRLKLRMAHHETVSDALIRDSELTPILKTMGSGFHSDVADVIDDNIDPTIYSAVVSSQFDADRLDYMRRDKLMCGTGHGAIDFNWLMANIEIGTIATSVDNQKVSEIETFVLGPKALFAAEAYVLGLFQLYPTVYFHKATRGAEKIFSEVLCRIIELCIDGSCISAGLDESHPIVKFAKNPDSLDCALNLDDQVIFGALAQTAQAKDQVVSDLSIRLRDRKLFKAVDIRKALLRVDSNFGIDAGDAAKSIDAKCLFIEGCLNEWRQSNEKSGPRILFDKAERSPYKTFSESKGPLNQIMIRGSDDSLDDLQNHSQVVRAIEPFKMCRVYVDNEDENARLFIEKIIGEAAKAG